MSPIGQFFVFLLRHSGSSDPLYPRKKRDSLRHLVYYYLRYISDEAFVAVHEISPIGLLFFFSSDIVLRATHYIRGKNEIVFGTWFIITLDRSPMKPLWLCTKSVRSDSSFFFSSNIVLRATHYIRGKNEIVVGTWFIITLHRSSMKPLWLCTKSVRSDSSFFFSSDIMLRARHYIRRKNEIVFGTWFIITLDRSPMKPLWLCTKSVRSGSLFFFLLRHSASSDSLNPRKK
jgi:hypothetical protein